MEYVIKSLTPDLAEDYFDFFDNRAFSDGSPFYPCYCNAFNLSKERMEKELYQRAEDYGNGLEGWIRALRESAERMVQAGEIKGYLAYDNGIAIGWCNSNDRMSYYRTGEFDLHTLPDDEEYTHNIALGEVKAIVCFEISPEYRGKGIATQFLRRICDDARLEGYKYVEAYPVKDGENIEMAFTGPLRLYEKAGFEIFELSGNTYTVRKKLIL